MVNMVDLETADWAYALGFPQEESPCPMCGGDPGEEYCGTCGGYGMVILPPHPVDLLEWLEREKGWHWTRTPEGGWGAWPQYHSSQFFRADTAADLLAAIRQRMQ